MKSTFWKAALGATVLCSALPALAHIVQPVQSPSLCPTPSQCIVAGGATSNPAQTLHVTALKRVQSVPSTDVPEPGSLALMGIGAIAVGYISRRYGARKP